MKPARRTRPLPLVKLRLFCALLVGALAGLGAGTTTNRYLQLFAVCIAVVVGINAGLSIREARKNKQHD